MCTRQTARLALFGLGTVALLCFASAAHAQTYPIKCRSGGLSSFTLSVTGALRIAFQKAPAAAGPNGVGLLPGQCAWVDRPVNANEPSHLSIPTGPHFKVGAVVPGYNNASFDGYVYAETQAWVYQFSTQDVILTLYVQNDGQYLVAPNP
jgi:hypothetical protein